MRYTKEQIYDPEFGEELRKKIEEGSLRPIEVDRLAASFSLKGKTLAKIIGHLVDGHILGGPGREAQNPQKKFERLSVIMRYLGIKEEDRIVQLLYARDIGFSYKTNNY